MEMELLAIGLVILVVGLMFPYHVPLFGAFILGLLAYASVNLRIQIPGWVALPYLGVALFFIWGVYNSQVQHPLVEKDFRNLSTLSIFGLLAFSFIRNEDNFKGFRTSFIRLVVALTTLVSAIGLFKFLSSLKSIEYEYFRVYDGLYPWGTSLMNDTNYYALGGIIGLTAYVYAVLEKDTFVTKYKLHILAGLMMTANVMLAGSRRGIVLLAVILGLVTGIWLFKKIRAAIRGSRRNMVILISTFALVLIIMTQVKVRHTLWIIEPAVTLVGLDFGEFKEKATIVTFRYMTILNSDLRIEDYYKDLWNEESTIDLSKIRALNTRGVESRKVRWELAVDIYKQHDQNQKMIGSGFDYLQVYEAHFTYMHNRPDYPHNPFLSALLYSGIMGLSVFVLFILQVTFFSLKHLKRESFFASLFVIVFIFNLISGNTYFSVKLLPALCLILLVYPQIFSRIK
ncbi:O-antigen ligase family protein [Flavobacteriales bacterium AH-315-E23]|nr:O-antigen ligase family protein [Flavobacteriales bacterium AH-315-E23]